jgi:hypothetical protein
VGKEMAGGTDGGNPKGENEGVGPFAVTLSAYLFTLQGGLESHKSYLNLQMNFNL